MSSKRYRPWNPDQMVLFPHAMRDALEEGHIVEPVFGHVKEARRFRRFSLRGITKVRGEWTLVSLVHNLLKVVNAPLHSYQQAPQLA